MIIILNYVKIHKMITTTYPPAVLLYNLLIYLLHLFKLFLVGTQIQK